MERTLDPIPSSDEEVRRDHMSYLYGRDPSILAHGERPLPRTKQNLIALYEDEENKYTDSTGSESITLQTVKVYLRVKPLPRKLKLTKEEIEAYQVPNSTTLVTNLPSYDHNSSSLKGPRCADTICRKFTFTKTFGPETTQLELFEQVIQQRMVDFLAGQNSTVMTYGTTNSGKSYTLQGTTTSPGIIPRGLEFVFSNITPRPTPSYKPSHNSDVVSLSAVDRAQELESKNKLLTFASIDKHQYINAYKQMQKLLQEESPIRPSQAYDAQYSVWVSFAEIYNENVYDLLSNESQKRRPLLKIGTDGHGRAFIKGLKTVCVNSGSEAYQVLMAGQYNLKVAATALNARSSRSHCIFTIKLLKYYVENSPERVEVSTFAFCDLAGSERLKKTLNVGERLKEAQNINTSLLVLGRCLKSIYESQSVRQRLEHVVPFRESKLTRLFQNALSGREQIALIVNVNPIPNLYVETQNVLNFSAIVKKIIVEPKRIKRRVSNSRFSQLVAQSVQSSTDWDTSVLSEATEKVTESEMDASVFFHQDEYDDLVAENTSLKKELGALRASMLNRDLQIRQELADTYTAMMKKLENDWKDRIRDVEEQQEDQLEWTVNRVETFYKAKISELTSRKRRRLSDDDSDEDQPAPDELEVEIVRLTGKIKSLKNTIKKLRESNENVATEKNKLSFELGLTTDELKSVKSLLASAQHDLCGAGDELNYVEKLRTELSDKQTHIKNLKAFLNEAKEEYIAITADAGAMEKRLKAQEEQLAESQERVGDLEELLEQVNVCLAEKTKANEALEEKLQLQSSAAEETIRKLKERVASLEETSARHKSSSGSVFSGAEVKEEPISAESEGETFLESPKSELPEGIFVKTDDLVLGIPRTSYDGESEVFVQVQEIDAIEQSEETDALMELRAKLLDTNAENESLKQKCAESLLEIDSLRESFEAVKNQLSNVHRQLGEYKTAQAIEGEKKALEDSTPRKTCDIATSPHLLRDRAQTVDNFCQTTRVQGQDQTVQTSFIQTPGAQELSGRTNVVDDEELADSRQELQALRIKHSQLEAECQKNETLMQELREELKDLHKKSSKDRELLEERLTAAIAEKESVAKVLTDTTERLTTLEGQLTKCRDEYEPKISDLERELIAAKEREETKSECIKVQTDKTAEMESAFALRTKELEDKLSEMTESVERCESDKKDLDERLKINLAEIELLQMRIECADKKELEREEEIRQLQKAIKNHLSAELHVKKMETEMKLTLKELCDTREALSRLEGDHQTYKSSSNKEILALESQISALEENAKVMAARESEARTLKEEMVGLMSENHELKALIAEKELEMESFTKNRDETIAKYEQWVKTQQQELERGKREITRFQELFHRMPSTPKSKGTEPTTETLRAPIPVVDLSDSETKRTTRRTALAPPSCSPPSSHVKRTTRKKRLYQPVDDSCVDLETSEAIAPTPSPSTSTRSLRTRRK